jgi:hypothetical protein
MSDHYKSHPSGIEAIEITQYESFLRGNIIKYVMRAPYKGSELEDLQKAQQYLTWEIERIKEEQFWENFDNTVVKDRLAELNEMRSEWDSDENISYVADNWEAFKKDSYDYYRAGISKTLNNVFKPGKSNYTFDEVVFPDKCQECEGKCNVCEG